MDTAAPVAAMDSRKVGLATLIAGICFIVASIGSGVFEPFWILMIVGFALLAYSVPRLHRHQAPADGALGLWGSRLVAFGAVIVLALGVVFLVWELVGTPPEEDPGIIGPLWMIGFFGFAIGVVLFTIGSIRAKVFPQAAPTLMLVGLVAALVIDMATGAFFEDDGTTTEWGFFIGVPLFGLGLAWIGYSLWKPRDITPESAAAPTV